MARPALKLRREDDIRVEYLPSARDLLTAETDEVVGIVLDAIEVESSAAGIDTAQVTVEGHVSPEWGEQKVIVTQWVDLDEESSLDYWNRLVETFHERTSMLSKSKQKVARERLQIAVRWAE